MRNLLLSFFACLITGFNAYAQAMPTGRQVQPAPGAKLNYTQVMFEYEKVRGVATYIIQVAEDKPGASFDHCLISQIDSSTATMISGLRFGKKYIWRYAGITGYGPLGWRGPYHFEIIEDTMLKLKFLDLKVSVNDSANAGGLIFNDGAHVITDRAGHPVWCLPDVKWQFMLNKTTADVRSPNYKVQQLDVQPRFAYMRLTPYGTITYMTDMKLIECDLDGNILWQKNYCHPPSELGENAYNHAFMRMPNGHYMTLGNEMARKMPAHLDNTGRKKYVLKDTFDGIVYARVEFGTVLEYDKQGDLVWSWNSEDQFDKYGAADPADLELTAHINALSTDRNNEYVYLGFRNINRIVKVQKSTGRVADSWGTPYPGPKDSFKAVGPMHHLDIHAQHNSDILDDGTILIYNNNDYPGKDSIPSVIIFSQQPGEDGKVVWKYNYDLDTATRHIGRIGGSAQQLRNGNILVCTGTANHIFEVTRDKKIVWKAILSANEIPNTILHYRLCSAYQISSLYPCYFTFQTDRDTVPKSDPQFSIRIFNEGSEDDAYNIKLSSATGEVVAQFSTDTITHGRSMTIPITWGPLLIDGDTLDISISSKTNLDLQRKYPVVITE